MKSPVPGNRDGQRDLGKPGLVNSGSAPSDTTPLRAAKLRRLIESPELAFLMEAHNGLSAKIVEEAGFEAIWASGLSISASLGVRDSNEASWTQILEVLEFMCDATQIPILVDGDTGYGNFNNMRRLVRKLEQRNIAGVCIEDKIFPKTNSFLGGATQPLADINEFCGRIQAGKDEQISRDFVIVARVEAFIAGWGLREALKRAQAYHEAGADAILIHSARNNPGEILSFMEEWGDRAPVVIVPTKYYATPTDTFRDAGISTVIWANHMMRTCITAMQDTVRQIFQDQSLVNVEDRVAGLAEVFRLQGAPELAEAEKRYLPERAKHTRAIILAAAQGLEMAELTTDRPKAMVHVSGRPILSHIVQAYRDIGVKDIKVVRGYKKEAVVLAGVEFFDNDEAARTSEAFSLSTAISALEGRCLVCYGDVLFRKFIPQVLMELDDDFSIIVDTNWKESRNRARYADYVTCSEAYSRATTFNRTTLVSVSNDLDPGAIHGEWMGFLHVSEKGAEILRKALERIVANPEAKEKMDMGGLMRALIEEGHEIRVLYTTGNWLDIDSVEDVVFGNSFQ
ncbi:MAG: phosphoenolpyruvate mutase [Acidobacteria bacterium]|nr:MAG: phosphoenolpyruvate mutase [Acidobacteriota bacterium]